MKNHFGKSATGLLVLILALFVFPVNASAALREPLPDDGLSIPQERLSLEIRTVNVAVVLTLHNGEELFIEYLGDEENKLFYSLNDGLLKIFQENENFVVFNEGSIFNEGGILNDGWNWTANGTANERGSLSVFIPVNSRKFNSITINTASGAVNIDSFIAETLRVNSASGSVSASGIVNSGDFRLSTHSGSIDVDAVIARNININSVTGSMRLENFKIDDIGIETHSGAITANVIIACNISISSVTGSTRLENSTVNGDLDIETQSGAINLENVKAEHRLNLNSITGRIIVNGQNYNN